MPPCGVWTLKAVPAGEVDQTVAEFQLDNPKKIEKKKNADGSFDIVAIFPPCADGNESNQPEE